MSTNQVTTWLKTSMPVSPSLLPAWGFGAAPAHTRDPKSDSLQVGAGKINLPVVATLWGGRMPSLAWLVANGCFLTFVGIRISEHTTPFPDRTQTRVVHEFFFNYDSY